MRRVLEQDPIALDGGRTIIYNDGGSDETFLWNYVFDACLDEGEDDESCEALQALNRILAVAHGRTPAE